jgi:hypothetical protein
VISSGGQEALACSSYPSCPPPDNGKPSSSVFAPPLKLLCALGSFVALTLVKTYPLILHLGTHFSDPGDPQHLTWILAWDVHALRTNPLRLFDANIFYPVERSLAFSEHLLGVLPIFAPVYFLTGNPVAGYNVLFGLTFALSALAMYCLAYQWTGAFWPSLAAGTLFGFAPFRFGQHGHLHLLCFFWAPLALVFQDQFLRTRRWRHLAGFAVFFWLQVLSSLSLAFMVTVAVVLYASYYVVFVDRTLLGIPLLTRAGAFVAASLILMVPLHLPYFEVRRAWGFVRPLDEVLVYTPDILNYLSAPPFMNDVYRALFHPVSAEPVPEKWLFPGLVLPILVLLGSRGPLEHVPPARVKLLRRVFTLILGTGVVISLGPYLSAFGQMTRIPLPYLLLHAWIPGFDAMRVPGRFALLAVFAACPLAALGAVRCAETVAAHRKSRAWRWLAEPVVSVAIISLVFLELGWKPLPMAEVPAGRAVPEVYRWLASARPGPILELPIGGPGLESRYVYLSTAHWLPLANGLSSYFPPTYAEARQHLSMLPGTEGVEYAAALGIKAVVVHTATLSPEQLGRWSAAEATAGGLKWLTAFGTDLVYSVPTVTTGSSLTAEVYAPDWLPVRQRVTVPMLLRSDRPLPWAHPKPYGRSGVAIQWTDLRTARSFTGQARVELPLVLPRGQTATIPLMVSPPDVPGRYVVRAFMPSARITIEPRTVEVRSADLPTSRHGSRLLSVSYIHRPDTGLLSVTLPEPVHLDITAMNTGGAVWLAWGRQEKGAVKLGWRWLRPGHELPESEGRIPILYDVFPGQRYEFRAAIPPPLEPGSYVLEVGLVSELVAWMSDLGSPPLAFHVNVQEPRG